MKLNNSTVPIGSLESQCCWNKVGANFAPELTRRSSQKDAQNQRNKHFLRLRTSATRSLSRSASSRYGKVEQITKRQEALLAHYVPVFVMLPLDVIESNNRFERKDELRGWLEALKTAGVDGLMVDVWWGIVEGRASKRYNWAAYRELFELAQENGFKIQAIMSFHGCKTGRKNYIPLPQWVLDIGESNPDIFFTNKCGYRNKECLSFGVDDEPILHGRTGIEVYTDFMSSFKESMSDFLHSGLVTEIEVGLGSAGELRYPSFTGRQGWKFPGIGEFQCYDKYLKKKLQAAAKSSGNPEWGLSGPQNAGDYNDCPENTEFFCENGTFQTDQGKFFLTWYSNILLLHGDQILDSANDIFEGCNVKLAAKVAGIHWWYNSASHAAELAAGYYNLSNRDGYRPIARMLSRHHAALNFTCIEMRDSEQPEEAACGPEKLVHQVLSAGWREGIEVACENALPRYDRRAYRQIIRNARPNGILVNRSPWPRISAFTYLRLSKELIDARNLSKFKSFVREMHANMDYCQDCEKYFNPRVPLQRSTPKKEFEEFLINTAPAEPFCFGPETQGIASKIQDLLEEILDKFELMFELKP